MKIELSYSCYFASDMLKLLSYQAFLFEDRLNFENLFRTPTKKGHQVGRKRLLNIASLLLFFALFTSGCLTSSSNWTRRDMPTDGLQYTVTYKLKSEAGSEEETNQIKLRGINENAALNLQVATFDRMSGSKVQDVQVTLPSGVVYQALGMNKPKRFDGLTRFTTLEPATYSGVDYKGNAVCGAKIRLDFNRNFVQYLNPNQRDFQSLWYYDIPCKKVGEEFKLDTESAKLRALVLNQVWQLRIGGKSSFYNWGHSVTIVDGPPSRVKPGWWKNWDIPNTTEDTLGAVKIVNEMVRDLETSPQPWLEFSPTGAFKDSYLIYSAGDADQYTAYDRFFLNRQREYAIFYRPNRSTPWDFMRIVPQYNMEWNDIIDNVTAWKGWFDSKVDSHGNLKDPMDPVVKEIERVGFMNAPNPELDQIRWYNSRDSLVYAMTVRAHIGASDTLIMFGRGVPNLNERKNVPLYDNLPQPIVYDDKGQPKSQDSQPYNAEQWAEWQREASFWNFLKDNPISVGSEFMVQYRFVDNTTWAPIFCTNSDGASYTCGYNPVEWNLSTSYFMEGDPRNAWLASQLLGEVGVRTLGMSYVSGRYEGTGLVFAMAQLVHRNEFFSGYTPESIYVFDARAAQLPDRLAEAWKILNSGR